MTATADVQAQADALGWYHSIDLGDGVVTKGTSGPPLPLDRLPEFEGRSVLDIGAWDGYYSFLAERQGARQVVALDHYAWGVDGQARDAYWRQCMEQGTLPDHSLDATEFWQPELPGRRGFEFAAATLRSSVEPRLADFTTVDLGALGTFDVVLYLGVLYHMKEPLTCLERVRAITHEVAVIETEAVHFQHLEHESILQFFPGANLNADFGNWCVPTMEGLHSLCRAAGFTSVQTVAGPPAPPKPDPEPLRVRVGRRLAGIPRRDDRSHPSVRYRAVVHAFV
jgi:tRNA (mo5U34)-methyltransferase